LRRLSAIEPAFMAEPRLKSEIRAAALIRRAQREGAFAVVARRGDPDAGSIAVKVYQGSGRAKLYVEARDDNGKAVWREPFDRDGASVAETEIDAYLDKERRFDSDLWIIEIEDRAGRSFTDDASA